ncbi:MAG TPA: transposase [Candidatus Sulfotelmatobacter sp.]|nr:transposase [Candidatus Sulfotelmatobacter sp.]
MENLREQRGLILAATKSIRKIGGRWVVPSQTGAGMYSVFITNTEHSCSCPDYETRRQDCKHVYAALYVMRREENPDGSTTVTEAIAITETPRPTYPQAWTAYNTAQTSEKERFQSLLFELCRGIQAPPVKKNGRPSLPVSDAIFSAAFKVYSTVSTRRFMTDLREAQAKGFIRKTPHFNSISNCLENPEVTPIIRELITQSSLPLRAIETDFAVDSSGFTAQRSARWVNVKYGKEHVRQDWVKVHIACGVKTNIVTAVEIGGRWAADRVFFPPLIQATAKNFQIAEVSADKGYDGRLNTEAVMNLGAMPFIAFKSNATGSVGGAYQRMFHYFMYNREEFLRHYHKRSNVESTFSAMKRKFGDSVRSKTDTAMVNETLCKILCHNLVVLIHEMHELGITPEFSPQLN